MNDDMMSAETIRVLVVEDDPDDIFLVREMLSSDGLPRFVVEEAPRLADALQHLGRGGLDAVLLDINLPDSRGLDTVRRLRAAYPDIPAVICTGNRDPDLAAAAVREGIQDYLPKDKIDSSMLKRVLRYAVERAGFQHTLNAAQYNLQQMIENSIDGIVVLSADDTVFYANTAAKELFHGRVQIGQEFGFPLAGAGPADVEVYRPDAKTTFVEIRKGTTEWLGQQAWIVTLRDVTERKKAEEAARLSEEKYRSLVMTIPDIVYAVDPDGIFTFVNNAVMELGYQPAELIGRHYSVIIHPDVLPRVSRNNVLPNFQGKKTGGQDAPKLFDERRTALRKTTHLEVRLMHKNGQAAPTGDVSTTWEVTAAGQFTGDIKSPGKIFTGTLGIIRNITERKKAEEKIVAVHRQLTGLYRELEESNRRLVEANVELTSANRTIAERESRFSQLADSISEMFWLYDVGTDRFVYVNKAFETTWGVTREDAHALSPLDPRFSHPDDRAAWLEAVRRLKDGGCSGMGIDYRMLRGSGDVRWLGARLSAITGDDGKPFRIAAVTSDITEIRNAVEKEQLHQLQLIQSDKMASLGLLVSGIAHEINNPNNYISLSAPLLRKAWQGVAPAVRDSRQQPNLKIGAIPIAEFMDNFEKLIDGIEEGSKKIKRIVADLKDYARQDTAEMLPMDLNKAIDSAMNLLAPTMKKKTLHVQVEKPDVPVMITGNLQRIEQVIINLVQNACDALTAAGQSVTVCCEVRGPKAAVVVQDTGCGIPAENLGKIVDPFFTTKRESGGTGLGLAVSMGIVKDHGGEMLFDSTVGRGTTVTLLFNRTVHND